jgi:pyrimidine-nucleoside phosphorylase
MVAAQGGDARVADDPGRLPRARLRTALASPRSGFVTDVDAMGVALAALHLGAGRARAEDRVDHAVGVDHLVKVGDPVRAGDALCRIHAKSAGAAKEAAGMLLEAIAVGGERRLPARLVDEVIGA